MALLSHKGGNMKVILVNGSPNKKGCTNRALEEISLELNKNEIETEIFWIGNKPISGCLSCGYCKKNKKCVIDDIVNSFSLKAKEADGFIFGSPVYYASPNGSLISFLDRLFYAHSSSLTLKPAAAIFSARRAGTTASYDVINKYFGINQMPIISSRYWNMVHGNTPSEVEQDAEGLQIMRILARNMAYFLKCIEAGQKQGVKKPLKEDVTSTNFIR